MTDPHDLERFVTAQENSYQVALAELRAGRKESHWMWWIFPQIAGLGSSPTSQQYAVKNLDEARAYLSHPILGERLREATRQVLEHKDLTLREIFGWPDHLKFHSSMTLFAQAADSEESLFAEALQQRFGGVADDATLGILKGL